MKISTGVLQLWFFVVLISNVKEGVSSCSGGFETNAGEYEKYCKNVQSITNANCKVIHPADRYECEADTVCANSIEKIVKKLEKGGYNGVCTANDARFIIFNDCIAVTEIKDGAAKPVTNICPASTTSSITVNAKSGTNCKELTAGLKYTKGSEAKCAKLDGYTLCKKDGTECIKRTEATLLCDSGFTGGTAVPAEYAICDKVNEPTIAKNCENIYYKGYTHACTTEGTDCTEYDNNNKVMFTDTSTIISTIPKANKFYCKDHTSSANNAICTPLTSNSAPVNFVCDKICESNDTPLATASYKYLCTTTGHDCKQLSPADQLMCGGKKCEFDTLNSITTNKYKFVCKRNVGRPSYMHSYCVTKNSRQSLKKWTHICQAKELTSASLPSDKIGIDCRDFKNTLKYSESKKGNCADITDYMLCESASKCFPKAKYLCDSNSGGTTAITQKSFICLGARKPTSLSCTNIYWKGLQYLCPNTATGCEEYNVANKLFQSQTDAIARKHPYICKDTATGCIDIGSTVHFDCKYSDSACTKYETLPTTKEKPTTINQWYNCDKDAPGSCFKVDMDKKHYLYPIGYQIVSLNKDYLCVSNQPTGNCEAIVKKIDRQCVAKYIKLTTIYTHKCSKSHTANGAKCVEYKLDKGYAYNLRGYWPILYNKQQSFLCNATDTNTTNNCDSITNGAKFVATYERPAGCGSDFQSLPLYNSYNYYYSCVSKPYANDTTKCFKVGEYNYYKLDQSETIMSMLKPFLCLTASRGFDIGCQSTGIRLDRRCVQQTRITTKPGAGNQLTASWIFTTASILFATIIM